MLVKESILVQVGWNSVQVDHDSVQAEYEY